MMMLPSGVRGYFRRMERPNTIAGLQAKRRQLVKLRKDLERDARKVTCDLDHIDACIRLFDPAAERRKC